MSENIAAVLERKGRVIWHIAPEATVFEALTLMADRDIGAVLVVSGGVLVGILSERDYARKVILHGRSSKDTLAGEVMSTVEVMIRPDQSVEEGMKLMTQNRVRHLPVLDDGQLVGLVSIGDLVNAIIREQAQTIQE